VASTATSITTVPVTITTTIPGRILEQFVTTYTATTTIAVPYTPSVGAWTLVLGPENHCYVVGGNNPITYLVSDVYDEMLTSCSDEAFAMENFSFIVYSSASDEWICYEYLPLLSINY
jgi:hypothetical protein